MDTLRQTTVLTALLLLCAAVVPVQAQEASVDTVFTAMPTTRVSSGPNGTVLDTLPPAEQEEFRVTIVRRDGGYYWQSREGRELTCTNSGLYTLFLDLRGGGYIKLQTQTLGSDSHSTIPYYEHLTMRLVTITYWGEGNRQAEHWNGEC